MRALRRLIGPVTAALTLSIVLSTGASAGRPPIALGLSISPAWGTSASWWGAELDTVGTRAPAIMSMLFAWNGPREAAPQDDRYAFVNQPAAFPAPAVLDMVYNRGAMPLLMWQPNLRAGETLQTILNGKYDDYIASWARAAAADGRPMMLRFAQEMNAGWFPWGVTRSGNSPEDFVAVWRKVWNAFRGPGGADARNVSFMWAPTVQGAKAVTLDSVYPGSDYVQIIGLDGYNFYDQNNPSGAWRPLKQIFENALGVIATRWPTKPVVIAEVGSVEDHDWDNYDKGLWLKRGLNYLYNNQPQVVGLVYFNIKVPSENNVNWRLDTSDSARSAWQAVSADPRFQGTLSASQLAAARSR